MEEKNFTRLVISFFVLLSFVFSYYMGYFSAKLGVNPVGINNTAVNNVDAANQPPARKNIEEASFLELNGTELALGDKNAKIQIIEFNDFECPYCARFHETINNILQKNKDVVVFTKHLPLPFHQNAKSFATIFECIAKNSSSENAYKFADEHFAQIRNGTETTIDTALGISSKYGVNKEQYDNCSKDQSITDKISKDTDLAREYKIEGTPGSIIQNRETKKAVAIFGALPEVMVQAEIDKLLQ